MVEPTLAAQGQTALYDLSPQKRQHQVRAETVISRINLFSVESASRLLLIESLFAADGVDLIDDDYRRRAFLRLPEEISGATGAHPDEDSINSDPLLRSREHLPSRRRPWQSASSPFPLGKQQRPWAVGRP